MNTDEHEWGVTPENRDPIRELVRRRPHSCRFATSICCFLQVLWDSNRLAKGRSLRPLGLYQVRFFNIS